MPSSLPDLTEKETRTEAVESPPSEDLETKDIDISHSIHHGLLLQDTNYTKDTVAASEHLSRRTTEKRRQGDGDKERHVGFWHQELNNVRLHVLKLWTRTGEVNHNACLSLAVDAVSVSLDPNDLRPACALPLQWRFLSYTEELLIVNRLRRRL